MTKTLPITKVRQDLPQIIDRSARYLDEFVVTVNGYPSAVILPFVEYESWKETNEILNDPKLVKSIKKGEEDIAAGRVYDWEDVKKQLGINV